MNTSRTEITHPSWVRITHWVNACSMLLLVASGWRIYNAAPFLPMRFPRELTIGGWLGGALQWHFAAMWLLVGNALVYAAFNLATGRLANGMGAIRWRDLRRELAQAVRGRLDHADPGHYNAIQRWAYALVMADAVLVVVSGLVLWKSVQFPVLRELLGGYEAARRVHFAGMVVLVAFAAGHVALALAFPRTLLAMIRGR